MHTNRLRLAALLALILAACGPSASPSAEALDPAAVVQGFYDAYNAGDLEAAMAFVDEQIQCRGHCYLTGAESFRAFIQPGMQAGDQITISDLRVEGNQVTFDYVVNSGGLVSARGMDAVIRIEDGLIVYFEIT